MGFKPELLTLPTMYHTCNKKFFVDQRVYLKKLESFTFKSVFWTINGANVLSCINRRLMGIQNCDSGYEVTFWIITDNRNSAIRPLSPISCVNSFYCFMNQLNCFCTLRVTDTLKWPHCYNSNNNKRPC